MIDAEKVKLAGRFHCGLVQGISNADRSWCRWLRKPKTEKICGYDGICKWQLTGYPVDC